MAAAPHHPDWNWTMKNWRDVWASMEAGSTIYLAGCCGEPTRALDALEADPELGRRQSFTGVWIPGVNRRNPLKGVPDASADIFFMTPALREDFARKRMRFHPLHYSAIYKWLAGQASDFTGLVQVTRPEGGFVSLGMAADFTPALLSANAKLIGEVNSALPIPRDAPLIPVERFAALLETDSEPIAYNAGSLSGELEVIAETVAGMIDDGDMVQFGIGKVQAAVLPKLAGHRNLGFHGGMISDPVLGPLEAGAFGRGIVTGVALGSRGFYEAIAERGNIAFRPVSHTHDAGVLAGIERLFSVGSAIEVDLFGQVNGEMIDGSQISGHGGLAEFARGAMSSKGGRSVVALPSRASADGPSRIRPTLGEGTVSSIARADADIVVTEFGIANLHTKDIDERAEALTAIAHPSFRDELASAWERMRRAM